MRRLVLTALVSSLSGYCRCYVTTSCVGTCHDQPKRRNARGPFPARASLVRPLDTSHNNFSY